MKIDRFALAVLLVLAWSRAIAADGLIAAKSAHPARVTMDRLETLLRQKALTIFARVDHAAGAAKIGRQLRPTELLIFGNPQGGTPFIECSQTVGIDLPLKALVWQDDSGQVWIGYNDLAYIAQRHGASQCPAVENLKKAVAGFVAEAAGPRLLPSTGGEAAR